MFRHRCPSFIYISGFTLSRQILLEGSIVLRIPIVWLLNIVLFNFILDHNLLPIYFDRVIEMYYSVRTFFSWSSHHSRIVSDLFVTGTSRLSCWKFAIIPQIARQKFSTCRDSSSQWRLCQKFRVAVLLSSGRKFNRTHEGEVGNERQERRGKNVWGTSTDSSETICFLVNCPGNETTGLWTWPGQTLKPQFRTNQTVCNYFRATFLRAASCFQRMENCFKRQRTAHADS